MHQMHIKMFEFVNECNQCNMDNISLQKLKNGVRKSKLYLCRPDPMKKTAESIYNTYR